MKSIRLVYNKSAGQNKSSNIVSDVIGRFSETGYEVTAFRASSKNSAEQFIKDTPKDTYAVVVLGGDGTLNKVVNFMMKYDIRVPIGIIPAGTSNDFANHLGLLQDLDGAIEKILKGKKQT